jgi:energy-coupling factor transporter transmembrane protein EcfT
VRNTLAFWGCGGGLLKSVKPHVRIISGVLVGSACVAAPLHSMGELVFVSSLSLCWILLASMPRIVTLRCAVASAILFLPFLLLAPWIAVGQYSSSPMAERFIHAGAIAFRSTCMLFIAASTIASLPMHEVHRGLAQLPLPRSLVALAVQLINQTMMLAEETARIVGVLRLRGASGVRGAGVFIAFPIVWMVRMLFRAERSAAAMAIRGYGIETAAKADEVNITPAELALLGVAFLSFAFSVFMRVREFL